VAFNLASFSYAIGYYFKVGFIASIGILISFIIGAIGFRVHLREMSKKRDPE
jgi:Trk-type K+ transport system membrane component